MIFLVVVLGIFWGDFLLKTYVETHMRSGKGKEICGGRILLRKYHNSGAVLNFLEKSPKLVRNICGMLLLTLAAVWFFLFRRKDNPVLLWALSLLLGGGASNLYDRMARGYVVDYVSFRTPWKWLNRIVFNISDFCIFLGAILTAFNGEIK